MPLSILCSVSSVAGLKSKLTVGVITAASFVLPTTLGSISIQGITGTYTSFTVSRTGGGLANFTSTVQTVPTNSFTDPTALNNNSQYTYTITPTNNGVAGTAFSAITNTTTGLSNGLIYSLASAPTLTYNGAGSSTSAISFTFTGGSYTNLSVQFPSGTFIATTTVSPYTGGSFGANTQNTYYVFAINGDNYGGLTAVGTGTNVTASSTSVNVCTWASAPTLTYNGAGSSQNAISFTYSGGTFSSLSIQTTLGTQITTITTSPYTSPSIYSINQQITYYACPVNQLSYYSTTTNYASVSVCTWATITAAVFVTPSVLGRIFNNTSTLTGITGTFTSYILTRTGGSQGTYTLSGQTGSTVTDTTTGLTNNTAYTYTLTPVNQLNYNGTVFTSITGSTTSGIIYTLAAATMSPALVNASGSTTSVFMSWTNTGYSSIRIQNTTTSGTISTFTTGSGTTTYNSNSVGALSTNTQYTYTFTAVNGDGNFLVGTTSTTLGTCTWASAPTLTYNGGGSTTTQISFTYSGGTFTSLSIQTTLGTQITTITTSPYTSPVNGYTANSLFTYYACPVNALGYYSTSTNYASVSVCTWASCNAPTFASTTSSGTTLTDTGTFSKVLINYSGGTASPASGTTFTGTNTYTQAYTTMASNTAYTFVCFPVNALNYQSSNSASQGVTTSAGGAVFIGSGTYVAPTTNTYNSGGVSYTTYIFTGSGSLAINNITANISLNMVAVGGGGGTAVNNPGAYAHGGGGGGGFISSTYVLTSGANEVITISVGAGGGQGTLLGGTGLNAYYAGSKGSSTILSYSSRTTLNRTADGGGAGGAFSSTSGTTGGSGGGAGGNATLAGWARTTLTDNQGNNGGAYGLLSIGNCGGGGGGAGAAGTAPSGTNVNGSGGAGKNSILPGINSAWYFSGGGGAGGLNGPTGIAGGGGIGGGGGAIQYANTVSMNFGAGGGSTYQTSSINNPSGTIGAGSNQIKSGSGVPNSGGGAGANPFQYNSTKGTPIPAIGGSGIVIISVITSSVASAT